MAAERTGLLSIIEAAGWPIWFLIACSIVALALIIERFASLRKSKILPAKLFDEVVAVIRGSLPGAEVVNKLAANSLLGTVLATGIRAVVADPRISEPQLKETFESAGRAALHKMERYLGAIGTIASAAPLLGLLGTVIGMIEIFASQSPGGGSNPQQLAHGISIALYNTAFGLIIAIPALLFYRYFRSRVEAYILELEQTVERFVPYLMRHTAQRGN
jgi:biopolymer transport protein ExbB